MSGPKEPNYKKPATYSLIYAKNVLVDTTITLHTRFPTQMIAKLQGKKSLTWVQYEPSFKIRQFTCTEFPGNRTINNTGNGWALTINIEKVIANEDH